MPLPEMAGVPRRIGTPADNVCADVEPAPKLMPVSVSTTAPAAFSIWKVVLALEIAELPVPVVSRMLRIALEAQL